MAFVEEMLAEDRQKEPQRAHAAQAMIQYYQSLAQQRPLTDQEQRGLDSAREAAIEAVTGKLSDFGRALTAILERLKIYVFTNSDLLDGAALLAAKSRGESDFLECNNEKQKSSSCSYRCITECTADEDLPCIQACDKKCGAPTCARTSPCLRPTWLPY
jgi:hypothetical protein